ncbi:hypothetical protein ABT112_23390 [Streptomyces sp. NPDC002055]|uniref:hypothetical protein n=1 Tax=Streptomyces sp. NPDC002055 TaxID=3154534 RepID=UPI00331F3C57
MRKDRSAVAAVVASALGIVMTVPSVALAADDFGNGSQNPSEHTSGDKSGNDISASAMAIHFDQSRNGKGGGAGPVTPAGDWTPPPCWYQPKWTAKQFKAYVEPIWEAGSTGYEWDAAQRKRYEGGEPYKDFNLDKQDEGFWWDSVANPDRIAEPAALSCDKPTFWVDKGDPPNVPNAVTPEMLGELAYDKIRVPDTEVELSPDARQTVNLPTWAWLDEAAFKPVSVTASIDALGISATTTATPVSLRLDPGTEDAELHPASGECPIEDGRIGTPYTKGQGDRTPPCGLTYLRASQDGPFPFKATLTWKISWEGSDGQGGDLPDGTFGTTTEVTVQEAQAVNR